MQRLNTDERIDVLRGWVKRVAPDLPEPAALPADVGPAFDHLRSGGRIDDEQAELAEAIVVPIVRPAAPVRDNAASFSAPWAHLNDSPIRDRLAAACAAVGQMETSAAETPAYAGTAFLVAPDLVMTTRHVAESFVSGIGMQDLTFRPGRELRIDFGNGGEKDPLHAYPIVAATMIHPYLDVALLRLGSVPPISPLVFWAEDPGTLEGRSEAVIGYPQFDPRYGSALQKAVLTGEPGVKRIMPGRVILPRLRHSLERQILALTHDSITLGGRSGAPVVDLDTGRVVGVTFASQYLDANFAIPASELARDPYLWDAGLTFDGAAHPDSSPWQEQWSHADHLADQPAADTVAVAAVPPSAAVRSAVDRLVAEHFSDAEAFRRFLKERDYDDVVRAVPANADSAELVRALDRRGLLGESFLQSLTSVVPNAPTSTSRGLLSPWLPQSMLSRAVWAVESIGEQEMEVYTLGSPWRDYLLGEDGTPETASATLERLAYDTRPEIHQVLAWLLRRLYESLHTSERERVDAVYEALEHVDGGQARSARAPSASPALIEPPAMQAIAYLKAGLEAARSVGLVRLPDRPGAGTAGSSAWLLTPRLVVVPAHVLLTRTSGGKGPHYNADRAGERAETAVLVLDFDSDRHSATEHKVQSLALIDLYLDMAILRLDAAVRDRAPLALKPDALQPNQAGLSTIHHPRLGPKQISRDGRVLRAEGNDVVYLLDTAPGSAGAPIFDDEWRVIAFHRAFQNYRAGPGEPSIRAKLGTSTAAILGRLRDRHGQSALWREVVAAQPSLKSINVNLARALKESEKLPVVLQLVDETPLGEIPGFHITSQSGDIVSGLCDGAGLEALINHPSVLSIDLSGPAGGPECAVTVPHIRATAIHDPPHAERGEKVLIGLIDSGIDVRHRAFCDDHGRTRIVAFWDQHDARSPAADTGSLAAAASPEGEAMVREFQLGYGALYLADDIEKFLGATDPPPTFPTPAAMAHGTVVAGIAAGRRTGDSDDHFAGGVAPAASLVVVRYDLQNASVGYSKGHLDAIDFIERVADRTGLPVVVNISNGMNAGAHDGTSPVERRCNRFTDDGQKPGRIVVKSAGNERGQGRHASIIVPQGAIKSLRWRSQNRPGLPPSQSTEEIEIWFHHLNVYRFRMQPPGGVWSPSIDAAHAELKEYLSNDNLVAAKLTPYRRESGGGFLNIKISPGRIAEVQQGQWRLEITGLQVPQRDPLHAWVELMPDRDVFFQDYIDDHFTVTIPGTAEHVISVGAVEVSDLMAPYEGSSWGPTRKGVEKPDLVAPGVAVFGPGAARGELRSVKSDSGTSLAAPHVTGAIALALSACVKSGREPHNHLRVRGALQETARHGTRTWNEETGYGALDAEALFLSLLQ